ncbi:MAG: peptidylprolyl isomerase [Candidatus Altiarchaeota archaeon]|nr:peptidylprolyl isomerase [Candidatus Altiarchaeota archaeon]
MRLNFLGFALVSALLLAGCISDTPDDNGVTASTEKKESTTSTIKMNEVVVFETSEGVFEVELYRDKAPITVENFLSYVDDGSFDGTVFHRVIDGFMIQGGGFTPDGSQKKTHAPIKLESDNGLLNLNGTIAMARTMVPDSATSQFFINVADNSFLDYKPNNPGYAVFGKVTSGMDKVMRISKVERGAKGQHQDWPLEDIVIKKAYVKE